MIDFIATICHRDLDAMPDCRFRMQEAAEYALLGPPHPGEIFREDFLPRLKLTRKAVARKGGISAETMSKFLNERRRVTRKLAEKLARATGTNALFWLVVQAHHDAWLSESRAGGEDMPAKKKKTSKPVKAATAEPKRAANRPAKRRSRAAQNGKEVSRLEPAAR